MILVEFKDYLNSNNVIIAIAILLLLLMFVDLNGNNITSYGQLLDKSYVNENCGISINYPSDWKFDDKIYNNATLPMNYIVEFQPNNEEDSISMVGIELHDISHLPDRSLESIKASEESNITMRGKDIIENSETIPIAGNDSQKIVYTVSGENNDRLKKMEIDVLVYNREYKNNLRSQ